MQLSNAVRASVIMPVYNAGPYLRPAIESVLAQTCGDFELLLVDDAATDGSGAVCDEFAARDSRIRVFHGRNGGISASRNKGLRAARGSFVAFCDHDDFLEPDMLATCLSALESSGLALANFKHTTFRRFPEGEICSWPGFSRRTGLWTIRELFSFPGYHFYTEMTATVWSGLYRRDFLLDGDLFFDETLKHGGEDCDYMQRVIARCRKGLWLDKSLYRHYINMGTSVSSTSHPELNADYLRIAENEQRLFGYSDGAVKYACFLHFANLALNGAFLLARSKVTVHEEVKWMKRYFNVLAGPGVNLPWRMTCTKAESLYLAMRLHCLSPYLLLRKAAVALKRRRELKAASALAGRA